MTARVPVRNDAVHPSAIAHVVLRSPDPGRLVEWYCNVLGAHVVLRHPMISFITWDHTQDRIAFVPLRHRQEPTRGGIGVDHVAFEMESLAALVTTYRRLAGDGIEPIRCFNHGVATSMYYRDPDGNEIELSVEHFDSVDGLNAWLASGDFDENPAGVALDAAELAEQVESGVDEASLLRPDPAHRTWLADMLRDRSAR
jgi:catechol 2,3-dioxygenase-like lactoylglutathione lyase family enzyme